MPGETASMKGAVNLTKMTHIVRESAEAKQRSAGGVDPAWRFCGAL